MQGLVIVRHGAGIVLFGRFRFHAAIRALGFPRHAVIIKNVSIEPVPSIIIATMLNAARWPVRLDGSLIPTGFPLLARLGAAF